MHAIGESHKICIMGLKKKKGYFVKLNKSEVEVHAVYLSDWCESHPEDAKP